MGSGHGHGHGQGHGTATGRHRNRLLAVFAITVTVMVAEAIGGIVSGSLALLADAGHMLTDATGVGLALVARVSPPAPRPWSGRSGISGRRSSPR